MSVSTSQSPYYDDYDPSKKYTQILAVPGRAEQAREFTQIQTLLLDVIKRLSSTILKEGDIVSGMSFTISPSNLMTVEAGQVYLNGIVHNFSKQSIQITGTGTENIGVQLNQVIITESDDATLRDPAQGYSNYSQPGAHRVKSDPVLTLNNSTSPTIYKLQNGSLQVDPIKPELNIMADILARRTYDEAGNYKVSGLNLWSSANDANSLMLTVDSGKAYVRGYEINKPASTKITVPLATITRAVLNEPKTFVTGTNLYPLNNTPVKDITQVVGTVQVTQNMTRGSAANGTDYLPLTPVVSIVSVIQGATTYVQGTDYQLTADGVDWSLAGAEPAVGSTYSVTWKYNKTMVQGTDYKLTINGTGSSATYNVDFSLSGDKPVNNSQFTANYEFYLARKDLISLDKDGNIVITTGQSDIPRNVVAPTSNNQDVLDLGTIYMPPNDSNAVVNSFAITRLSMGDLQKLTTRVENMEYNQALAALDDKAMSGQSPTALKGIFSDGFNNMSKTDTAHPDFNAQFYLEEGMITLPINNVNVATPTISVPTSSMQQWGRLVAAPMTEEVAIEQPYATTTLLVNPYNVYNKLGVLSISPQVDNWVDQSTITVQTTNTASYNIGRWWYHGGTPYTDTEKYLFQNLQLDAGQTWNGWDAKTGSIITNSARVVLDEATQYMRQQTITLNATNIIPLSDNLQLLFDGNVVSATPASPTYQGTQAGTLKSDSSGNVQGTFVIPANVRTGTREVVLKNSNNTATAYYTAQGRKHVIEDDVIRTMVTVTAYDPVAQSFQFDVDRTLTSVGLYFAAKDSVDNVTIQIRDMVNGYPGQTIYAQSVLTPSQINLSANGTVETKVTFGSPVICKAGIQYCSVIVSDSPNYSVFVGELGGKDLSTNNYVTRNPYLTGTLFTSANALTWTPTQTQDLRFRVYAAVFQSQGVVEFQPIQNLSTDKFIILASYLTPQNTGCTWQAKLDSGDYQPIGNYVTNYPSSVTNTIQLKATFQSDVHMSPLLAIDGFTLVGFVSKTSGAYVSKNTTFSQPFTTIKQIIEANVPSGCTVQPMIATDTSGTTWVTPTLQSTQSVDANFTQYTYQYVIPNSGMATNFRAKVVLSSGSAVVKPQARKFMNILT